MADEILINTPDITITEPTVTNGQEDMAQQVSLSEPPQWFALRDLTRINSKNPGYKLLSERGIEVFTPMKWKVAIVRGKRKRTKVPVMIDMLFAHADKDTLTAMIQDVPNIQFRYAKGAYCKPIVIRDIEMERFIRATSMSPDPVFYSPLDVSKLSIGKSVRIIGGAMQGIEGKIVNVRGARKKRILVSIPDFISAMVEVEPEYLEFV